MSRKWDGPVDPWQIIDEYRRSQDHIAAAVEALRAQGVRAVEIAERMGVSREWVYKIGDTRKAKR